MIMKLFCGVALTAGAAVWYFQPLASQLNSMIGMALVGAGLWAVGSPKDDPDYDDGSIDPADRVRNLQKE